MAHTVPSQVCNLIVSQICRRRKPRRARREDVDIETLETVRYRPLKQGQTVVAPRTADRFGQRRCGGTARRPGSMLSEPRIHPATRPRSAVPGAEQGLEIILCTERQPIEREFQLTDDRAAHLLNPQAMKPNEEILASCERYETLAAEPGR